MKIAILDRQPIARIHGSWVRLYIEEEEEKLLHKLISRCADNEISP